ncbi:hypothetical protein [Streptomyces sp. TLI_185]|uniref:hypothetical protein n=1 Tax=Streptomyces sp. TLI_185 TaxID=2485151 RepID=UPI0016182DE2|nr:hypothetical protein [Streptomyces sp. TLI_185]
MVSRHESIGRLTVSSAVPSEGDGRPISATRLRRDAVVRSFAAAVERLRAKG